MINDDIDGNAIAAALSNITHYSRGDAPEVRGQHCDTIIQVLEKIAPIMLDEGKVSEALKTMPDITDPDVQDMTLSDFRLLNMKWLVKNHTMICDLLRGLS